VIPPNPLPGGGEPPPGPTPSAASGAFSANPLHMQILATPLSFITEYVTVMQHLANALDILQGERKRILGKLFPTLVCLKRKLIQCRGSIKFTVPPVDSILAGTSNGFDSMMSKLELIL
jgi:hypothetical protein